MNTTTLLILNLLDSAQHTANNRHRHLYLLCSKMLLRSMVHWRTPGKQARAMRLEARALKLLGNGLQK